MKRERVLIIIFFLFQNIIHNMGHPVTPDFVRSLGIEDYMFGVFFAMMSLGLVIGGPIWGGLGDSGKKKKYIIIGLIIYSIGQFGFGYSGNQYLMIFFRLLSGLGVIASITLFTSHMVEITENHERARYLALIAAAITLGASIGYYFGGFLVENEFTRTLLNVTNNKEVFLLQSLLNLLYIGFIVLLFKDRVCEVPTEKKRNIFSSFKYIGKMDYRLVIFLIGLVFISIGQINLDKYIDIFLIDEAFNPLELGRFKMVIGGASLLTSLILVPLFAKISKQIGLMIIIQILSSLIVFYTFRSNELVLTVYTVFMLYIVLKALFTPLEQNYISLHAKEGEYGKVMGTRQSFIAIGYVIGPLLGGFLYEVNPILLFDSSAISFIFGMTLLLTVGILNKNKKKRDGKSIE